MGLCLNIRKQKREKGPASDDPCPWACTVGEVLERVWTVVDRSAVVEEGTIVTAVAGLS